MLNSLTLLRAMNGIYEEDVVMAGNSYFDEKQVKHLKTKRIISFALAAALILSLGIAAYAAFSSMTHRHSASTGRKTPVGTLNGAMQSLLSHSQRRPRAKR